MALRIFNTLTGRKEEFAPLSPPRVGMYVCGVTVYDLCHLGHGRGALVFDVVRRYLEHAGYRVTYVRNFTDIDDKIIKRAAERGVPWRELAETYIHEYVVDMTALGVRPADIEPKATDHVPEIIALVADLVAKGKAYAVDGDVYFRVKAFPTYGELGHRDLEEMLAGARVEVDERKQDPMDFALWKSSKPGEPTWESPWGPGRPGWHIECSAMAMKHLGASVDIHGGGKDLAFPHHENEIAQSEAATGAPFARVWMHNGFVNVNQEKMSKSLGNFFTIRDVLRKFDAEALRFFLLGTHYRSPIDFSDQQLEDATRTLDRIYRLIEEAGALLAGAAAGPRDPEAAAAVAGLDARFAEAMDDDFNTAGAIGELFKAARAVSGAIARGGGLDRETLSGFLAAVRRIGGVLGLFGSEPAAWTARLQVLERASLDGGVEPAWIEAKIAERAAARKARDFAAADRVRAELLDRGVTLEDGAGGTTWRLRKG
ncbi:MAG TPA: cysteine--tRNA ligase [Candidatus Methanoperedens sp.]|nr:cysteine--tRNA ligase [Candidatus Methanoperedens sp.]